MTTLFEDRERAAEYGFAHGEELRFLAERTGVAALGRWAAKPLGRDADAYAARLVDAHVGGVGDAALLAQVRADLEAAGASDAAAEAGAILTRATAEATLDLHGRRMPAQVEAVSPASAPHHRHGFWGWEV